MTKLNYKTLTLTLSISLLTQFSAAASSDEVMQNLAEKLQLWVTPKTLGPLPIYELQAFPEATKNRNHFDNLQDKAGPQYLIMHYTACNFEKTVGLFTLDIPDNRVSAHYVISEHEEISNIPGGICLQMVPEDKRSWHAGVSSWGAVKNLNAFSIGIENVNPGYKDEDGVRHWFKFDPEQIETLGALSQNIVQRYHIKPQNVLGHADIAPGRKVDPGILFPWEILYAVYNVGAWLDMDEMDVKVIEDKYKPTTRLPDAFDQVFFESQLQAYGYNMENSTTIHASIEAFKAHFSRNQKLLEINTPTDWNDQFWIWALNAKYNQN